MGALVALIQRALCVEPLAGGLAGAFWPPAEKAERLRGWSACDSGRQETACKKGASVGNPIKISFFPTLRLESLGYDKCGGTLVLYKKMKMKNGVMWGLTVHLRKKNV